MILAKLLDTAIDHFGRLGFEGASTRAIAKASGTAMSSITYNFGGKEGLYLAAADHIAAAVSSMQTPSMEAAQLAGKSRDQSVTALLVLIDNFAQMMLRPESEAWARFIVREQQHPTEAFDRLYEGAMKSVVGTLCMLIANVRTDLEPLEVRATAVTLFGQALVLRVGRASVCRILGVETIGDDMQALLRARIRANALCILSEKTA